MRRLIMHRLLQAAPVLAGITLVTFAMVHLIPGDPARALAGQRASPRILASIRHQLGIDRPLPQQYWHFISGLPHGQLGNSFLLHQTTDALVAARLPTTLFLVVYGVLIAIVPAFPWPWSRPCARRDCSTTGSGQRSSWVSGCPASGSACS